MQNRCRSFPDPHDDNCSFEGWSYRQPLHRAVLSSLRIRLMHDPNAPIPELVLSRRRGDLLQSRCVPAHDSFHTLNLGRIGKLVSEIVVQVLGRR